MPLPPSSRPIAATLLLALGAAAQAPMVFEPGAPGAFVARRPGMQVHVDGGGARLVLPNGRTLAFVLVDADGAACAGVARAEAPLPGRSHHLLGADPAHWRRDVPHHARVRCANVWPGVDVVWHARDGALEYDLEVAPGADARAPRIVCRGADRVHARADGSVELDLGDLELVQRPPIAFQHVDGERRDVPVALHVHGDTIAFAPGPYDPTRALVIDPQVVHGSYLGGNGADAVHAIATDAAGNLYLTGLTTSTNFPTAGPVQGAVAGLYDFFVTKLDPSGTTIAWSTYLGGNSGGFGTDEWPLAIAVGPTGEVAVLGRTESTNFPLVNAAQPALAGGVDAVVLKLAANGSQLLWSTYLGGSGDELDRDNQIGNGGAGILIDGAGDVFVAGTTWSTDFPVLAAAQPANAGGTDLFVARYTSGGARVHASYLGGPGFDELASATAGEPGRALLAGSTTIGFPTTPGVFDPSGARGFVASVDVATGAPVWATAFPSLVAEAAVDAAGDVFLVGTATGSLPTTMGVHQADHGGSFSGHGQQAFAARLSAGAAQLRWATWFGSPSANESFTDVAVDGNGDVHAFGTTSEHFGTPSSAALLVRFNPLGTSVVHSLEVASRNSTGRDLVRTPTGALWVVGETWATSGVATPGALQPTLGGNKDGFFARIGDAATTVRELKLPVDRLTSADARVGTVTLDGSAPAGGATIVLTSSSPDVAVPPTVFVPGGASTALVPVTTTRVAGTQQVTLTASWNGSDAFGVRLWPGPLFAAVPIVVPGPNGASEGLDVDAHGTVVGTTGYDAWRFHESIGVQVLGPGEAHGIADDGAVAGGNGATAFRWTPAGGLQSLGALQPGMFSIGYDASANGRVVGFSDFYNGTVYGRRAFVWTAGAGMQSLGTLGGDASVAYAINRLGAVTGSAALATAMEHPFLWTGAGLQDLGVLPGFTNGTGFDVNDARQVAGIMLNGSLLRAFRWTPGVGLEDLGLLAGDASSGARGINAHGWTVGWSSPTQPNLGRAMRHANGAMRALHDELSAEDAFRCKLVVAHRINDAGQIAATGTLRGNGGSDVAFRLDPALARPFGRGCPGLDGRVTALAADGHSAAGNTVTLHVSGRPGALALLVLGAGPASVPLPGGCELHLLWPPLASIGLLLDGAGTAALAAPLSPTFAPTSIWLQAATLDPAAANGVFTTSNGLELRVL